MFDNIEVNALALRRAEQLWREQSQGASQAATAVADASTAGFDPEVRPDVARFLDTWSTVSKRISTNVDDVSHGLEDFRNEFGQFEKQATEFFHTPGFNVNRDLS